MSTKKIIVVDDQHNVCIATKRLLEPEGYVVDAANDLPSAMKLINKVCYDVALVDINLEDTNYQAQNTDGVDVIKYIKSFNEGTRIIVLSAQQSTQFVQSSFMELGINNYISKKETKPEEELNVVEKEVATVDINRYGPTKDPVRGFSGTKGVETDIWISNAIGIFKPSKGASGLITMAKKVLNKYGPVVPKKGKKGGIVDLDKEKNLGFGSFWSRSKGQGYDLVVASDVSQVDQSKDTDIEKDIFTEGGFSVLVADNETSIEDYDLQTLVAQ